MQFCYINDQEKNKKYAIPSEIIEQPNRVRGSEVKYKCLLFKAASREIIDKWFLSKFLIIG